jgi:hypothetical protein
MWGERLTFCHSYSPSPLPVSLPQILHSCHFPVDTVESQHFTAQIFYLLTTCQSPDQGGKTSLPAASLLHNPSWCTPALLVCMVTTRWPNTNSLVTHTSVYAYITHPDLHMWLFLLDWWPWRWSTTILQNVGNYNLIQHHILQYFIAHTWCCLCVIYCTRIYHVPNFGCWQKQLIFTF